MKTDARIIVVAVVLVPLAILWIAALLHIVARRPDLSIFWKGIWAAVVLVVPYIGLFIYTMMRPPRRPKRSRSDDFTAVSDAIERLRTLAAAHEDGRIDDREFAARKAEIFGLADLTV